MLSLDLISNSYLYVLFFYLHKFYSLELIINDSIEVLLTKNEYTKLYLLTFILTPFFSKLSLFINSVNIYLNISLYFNFAFKFLVLISLLIFVRGGLPRYRFDFLTKIG